MAATKSSPSGGGARLLGYVPSLDGVRGLAIIMVVGLHVGFILHSGSPGPAKSYLPGGFIGVDMFFVLSGFLITALLLNERQRTGATSFPKFYARRACRLLPALAFVLVAHLAYTVAKGNSLKAELKALLAIAFYVSNITQSLHKYMPTELSHTWSLAVEEQFYVVWPTVFVLLLAWQARKRAKQAPLVPWLLPIGIAATIVIRIVVWRVKGYPAAYMLPFCRADALLIGCSLAYLRDRGRLPRRGAALAGWLGLATLVVICFVWDLTSSAMFYGGFTLVAVATALVMNALLVGDRTLNVGFSVRPLVMLGKVSYGLYLWHLVVLELFVRETPDLGRWAHVVLGLLLTAAVTAVSWIFVEQPALRLKKRFQPVPLAASTQPEPAVEPA